MIKLLKFIAIIISCLAIFTMAGSWWLSRSVGSSAYLSGALAGAIVTTAACSALVVTYLFSRSKRSGDSITGILLAMLIRMGMPLVALAVASSQGSPQLLESGFRGLLTLNYLVALPLETAMSLTYLQNKSNKDTGLVQHPITR